jgi:hypothetical protein
VDATTAFVRERERERLGDVDPETLAERLTDVRNAFSRVLGNGQPQPGEFGSTAWRFHSP